MDTTEVSPGPPEDVGDRIGPYKLRERIGEGGCGVVYVADQQEPVRRRVALKVIKLGMDTEEVVARFEAERQALAMMDHPNIAKVLDAGATRQGKPYFVMELVRGIEITDYCSQNKLGTRERLDLFIKVCHAVQHAHQKGIIHRDIKPSNILITLHDGVPVPKVIDFGIAKAAEGRLTDATIYTRLHEFIGTPAYMSPEQAEMSGLDVDTRSDLYSLGVILYELLTDHTPFGNDELIEMGVDAMRRFIREQEPPLPSTRLSTLSGDDRTATAKRRSVEAPRLVHLLRGDLDWIVMKCLEKDRTRRYATANALAADIQRHLDNEPIIARPPGTAYRFQKLVRRNKAAFVAGTAVAAVLLVGTAASAWQAWSAMKAREQAERTRAQEAQLRQAAEDTERLIEGWKRFKEGDFEGADAGMRDLPPEVIEAEFVMAAPVYRGLAHWHAGAKRWRESARYLDHLLFGPARQCEALYREAAGPTADAALTLDPKPYADLFTNQAVLLLELGDEEGYERLRQAAMARLGSTVQADTADAVLGLSLLKPPPASDRVALCRLLMVVQEHRGVGPTSPLSYALLAHRQGNPRQTLKWARRALEIEPGAARVAEAHILEAMAYTRLDRRDEARATLEQCHDEIDGRFRDGPGVGRYYDDLWSYWLRARILLREADALLESAGGTRVASDVPSGEPTWELAWERALESTCQEIENEPASPRTTSFAWYFGDLGESEMRVRCLRRRMAGEIERLGAHSVAVTPFFTHRSFGEVMLGQFDASEHWAREVLAIHEQAGSGPNEDVVQAWTNLGLTAIGKGEFEAAERINEKARSLGNELRGGGPMQNQGFWNRWDLGYCYYRQAKYAAAEKVLREILSLPEAVSNNLRGNVLFRDHGRELSEIGLSARFDWLAEACAAQGDYAEAEAVYRQALSHPGEPTYRTWDDQPRPVDALLRFHLAQFQRLQGKSTDGPGPLADAVRQDVPLVLSRIAWSLATRAEPARRDGATAVRLAEQAVATQARSHPAVMFFDPVVELDEDVPLNTLAAAYAEAGDFAKAIRTQEEAIALLVPCQMRLKREFETRLRIYRTGLPYRDVHALEALTRRLLEQGRCGEAEPYARECLALRRAMAPDDWTSYDAMSVLGAVCLGLDKTEEARALLHDGYQGMQERAEQVPSHAKERLQEAATRLQRSRTATGHIPGERNDG